MVWEFCVYFVYMIPLETDVLRKHRFQKSYCIFVETLSKVVVQFISMMNSTSLNILRV